MFSIITMASSTTNPVEMVSAISERLSRLKPTSFMMPNVPISVSGSATLGNDRRPELAQEDEDHHDHQHHRQHQRELHVPHRGADGFRAVGQDGRSSPRAAIVARSLRQQRFHAVGGLDDVRAGLALDVHDDRGLAVHPAGQADILDVVNHVRRRRGARTGEPFR